MKTIEPFKKHPRKNMHDDIVYFRKYKKQYQYVSMPYARGFNAAIREMERVNK